jgi:hypothetical protein
VNELRCSSCDFPRDAADNFCRNCGRQITVNLPAVNQSRLPAEPAPALPPALVGSVAALAIGTGLEWLVAGWPATPQGAARAAGRALVSRAAPPAQPLSDEPSVVIRGPLRPPRRPAPLDTLHRR